MSHSRYIRQQTFQPIGSAGQRRIEAASAVIVGCGALGSHIASSLARSGVGRLRIVDRDVVELDNLQRQALFDEDDASRRMPKAIAARRRLGAINSSVAVDAQVCEVTSANVESLLDGFDLAMDGTDSVAARLLVNDACLKAGIPCVFGSAAGGTGMTMPLVPGATACYRCLMTELPPSGTAPTAATAGMLHATPATVAALQCATALRLLTGQWERGGLLCVDVWEGELTRMEVPRQADCTACGRGDYEFLNTPPFREPEPVAGTNSVRLPPVKDTTVDLGRLAERWQGVGEVVANEWLVSLTAGGRELIIFADGRSLVKGTSSVAEAQALVERRVRGD
ncbi:MAG: ThiF family adenylyltransferase [Planctomycetota bacterium]